LLLAGLYDCTTLEGKHFLSSVTNCSYSSLSGEETPLWTFSIVTTDACSNFAWLHDRVMSGLLYVPQHHTLTTLYRTQQPVILTSKEDVDAWLDTSSQSWSSELTKLVRPYKEEASTLEWYIHCNICMNTMLMISPQLPSAKRGRKGGNGIGQVHSASRTT
jgi:putative SOS response-associated peptidase YedK